MRIAEKNSENMPARNGSFEERNSQRQRDAERKDTSGKSPFSSAHFQHERAEEHDARGGTHHGEAPSAGHYVRSR